MSDEDVEQFLKSQVGDTVTAHNEIKLKPDILINGEKRFFPIFSSVDQMGKEYASHFSTIEMLIDSIIDMLTTYQMFMKLLLMLLLNHLLCLKVYWN